MIDTEVSTLKKHITTAVTTLALLLIAGEAFAGGFYLPGRGVRPMGDWSISMILSSCSSPSTVSCSAGTLLAPESLRAAAL
jgi:hypothetical protein